MMTIGVDAHKRSHTAVVLNEVGVKVGEVTVSASPEGLVALAEWADQFPERRWAVEDCRHVTGWLERMLSDAGELAVRVPPHLTGPSRRSQRTAGKSDPVDAEAIAWTCLRVRDLPRVEVADQNLSDLKSLVGYRDQAVAARTELVNRLRWALHEFDTGWSPRDLTSIRQLVAVADRLEQIRRVDALIAGRVVARIKTLTQDINQMTLLIRDLVRKVAPQLLTIEGCAEITAAAIITRVGNIDRFGTEAKFGRYVGCAPIPASSGDTNRMRLHRGGNRQLNAAIHRISVTQSLFHQPAIDYMAKKQAEGKTKREARRALKRHITRRIYNTLTTPN